MAAVAAERSLERIAGQDLRGAQAAIEVGDRRAQAERRSRDRERELDLGGAPRDVREGFRAAWCAFEQRDPCADRRRVHRDHVGELCGRRRVRGRERQVCLSKLAA